MMPPVNLRADSIVNFRTIPEKGPDLLRTLHTMSRHALLSCSYNEQTARIMPDSGHPGGGSGALPEEEGIMKLDESLQQLFRQYGHGILLERAS